MTPIVNRTAMMLAALASNWTASASVATDSFSNTGSLKFPRHYHTATLLPNGKVLAAAGEETGNLGSVTVVTAELYDPFTAKWTLTGDLDIPRKFHTATLLTDGFVLVTGGSSNFDPLLPPLPETSCEVYNPGFGVWIPAGPLNVPRESHTATLMPDGKVLVCGGYNIFNLPANRVLNSAELFDPVTGIWTATGNMVNARTGHTAMLMPTGKVMVTGGRSNTAYLATVEFYDPAFGTWSAGVSMRASRQRHSATMLNDGTVLVSGGVSTAGAVTNAEIYFPETGLWGGGGIPGLRQWNTSTLLPDGKVLLTGGSSETGIWLSSGTVYDPVTKFWSPTPKMTWNRFGNSATLMPNGKTLIAGGFYGNSLIAAELYRQASGPYLDWKESYFGASATDPAVAGDLVDGDGDGIPNILEFALTGDPTVSFTGVLPQIGGNADVMELSFTRPETADVVMVIQSSSDLVSWSDISILPANGTVWGGSAVVNESQNAGTRTVNVQYTPPSQPAPVFYLRLAARRN